jgi:hypothetical protein
VNSKQNTEAIELTQGSSEESSDTRCGIYQQEPSPTDDKAPLSVLENACRYGAGAEDGGEDGGEATPQVDSVVPDEKAKASLPLSIDDNDARCASVCLKITDDQSWLVEPQCPETPPGGLAKWSAEITESAEGHSINNPIMIYSDNEEDDEDAEAARRASHCPTSPVSDHTNSRSISPDGRARRKRKRILEKDDDASRGDKIRCRQSSA